jgi:MoxR-like ATPase
MLRPTDVYTPGKLPLSKTNVYSPRTRDDVQRKLSKALERGLVPLVFGEYGVGKTSMARHLRRAEEAAGKLVNVERVSGKTMADVLLQCLE